MGGYQCADCGLRKALSIDPSGALSWQGDLLTRRVYDFEIKANYLFYVDGYVLHVVDISSPANMHEVASGYVPGGYESDLEIIGNHAFVESITLPDRFSLNFILISDLYSTE